MLNISNLFRWQTLPTIWLFISSFSRRVNSILPLRNQPVVAAPVGVRHILNLSCQRILYWEIKQGVLSLDLEENDYQIGRDSRIIYASIFEGDILPRKCRTDGDRVLPKLEHFPKWEEEWKRHNIRRTFQGIESTPDESMPHRLNLQQLNFPSAVFSTFETWRGSLRSTITSPESSMTGESWLLNGGTIGETPDIHNLRDCLEAVRLLHTFGVIHGTSISTTFGWRNTLRNFQSWSFCCWGSSGLNSTWGGIKNSCKQAGRWIRHWQTLSRLSACLLRHHFGWKTTHFSVSLVFQALCGHVLH